VPGDVAEPAAPAEATIEEEGEAAGDAAGEAANDAEEREPVDEPEDVTELEAEADESAHELPVDASTKSALPHREHVEQMFGASFEGVQAHVGVDLSALGARAAAKGDTVAFADARPSRELVAHEMTHVMQQRNAGGATGRGIAPEHSDAEREAETVEARAASGARVSATAAPAGAIHLKRAYARTDRYNKSQKSGRPKVTLGGKQTFRVRADTQRYSFIAGVGVRAFDVVTPAHHITINVSQPRSLALPGGRRTCVLARTRLGGSAWLPLDALDVNPARLAHAVRKSAGKAMPAQPQGRLKERVFKDATRSTDLSLTPRHASQSRAQYDHYLHRTSNHQVEDGFYNVCMALPQHGKVPTAVDIARPRDHFFIMQTREVPLYENGGGKRAVRYSRWAFGCMGKRDGSGTWKPDRSRRGWVPLEALT
jgi:hypothetical protein